MAHLSITPGARSPDPWAGSLVERDAQRPIPMCRDCGDVEVSHKDERCAECLVEAEDPTCWNDERAGADYGSEETP